jgi:hypothetical protein
MTALTSPAFPEASVRARARYGTARVFPPAADYGRAMFGASPPDAAPADELDSARVVPPVFVPDRLTKLIDLGREPTYLDVELGTDVGGFGSPLPLYVSAFGSTRAACSDLGIAVSRQAAALGIPMVIGENVVPTHGYRGDADPDRSPLLGRIRAYADAAGQCGGVVVQQSTEDADAEVWNLVYSDPGAAALLERGRLGFELKVGQGAKPGLGGMTLLDTAAVTALAGRYVTDGTPGVDDHVLRNSSPGTYTADILRQQVRLMRNNFPRARTWVKLHPGRDVADAATVAWQAGADAVTVDGAEGGSGWAPLAFLDHVGLPLTECLRRVPSSGHCLLASGRIWEGSRAVKALALGATAVGLGRAALLAADEDRDCGLVRFVDAMALELRLLISALGKYTAARLDPDDVWFEPTAGSAHNGRAAAPVTDERTTS